MIGLNIDTGEHEIFFLRDVKNIKYGKMGKKTKSIVIYETSYGSFTPITSLEVAAKAYKQFGFEQFDQSNLINRRKVVNIVRDTYGLKITFDDGTETNVSIRTRKRKK